MVEHQVYNKHIGMSLDEYIEKNKRLAYSVANRYKKKAKHSMDDFEDFEQICLLGLIKSYHDFDPSKHPDKEIKPSTYAMIKVKGEISSYLRDKFCLIRYPREMVSVWGRMRVHELESEKDPEKISEIIGIDVKWVKEALKFFDGELPSSMSSTMKSKNDDLTVEECIGKFGDFSTVVVNDFIETLDDPIDREIVRLRLQDKTTTEIGAVVGRHFSRVSKRLKKIEKLLHEYYSYV